MAMTYKDALEKYGSGYRLGKALLDLLWICYGFATPN